MKRYQVRILIGLICMVLGLYGVAVVGYFGCYMFGLGIGEAPDAE